MRMIRIGAPFYVPTSPSLAPCSSSFNVRFIFILLTWQVGCLRVNGGFLQSLWMRMWIWMITIVSFQGLYHSFFAPFKSWFIFFSLLGYGRLVITCYWGLTMVVNVVICIRWSFGALLDLLWCPTSLKLFPLFLLCFSRFFRLVARWRPGVLWSSWMCLHCWSFRAFNIAPSLVPCSLAYLSFYTVASECKWMQAICISSSLYQPLRRPVALGWRVLFIYFLVCFFCPLVLLWSSSMVCLGSFWVSKDFFCLLGMQLMCMDWDDKARFKFGGCFFGSRCAEFSVFED